MIDLYNWLINVSEHRIVQLFSTTDQLVVNTKIIGKESRRILIRHTDMENAIIEITENGLKNTVWEGLFYIMGKVVPPEFNLLYIGKAERKGVKNAISENIKNIRTNTGKFARWGDGIDYHIGGLSQALFNFRAYHKPSKKYQRWAENLFVSYNPPRLTEQIYLYVAPWYSGDKGPSGFECSLPAVEKEIIALASVLYKDTLLNVDGT